VNEPPGFDASGIASLLEMSAAMQRAMAPTFEAMNSPAFQAATRSVLGEFHSHAEALTAAVPTLDSFRAALEAGRSVDGVYGFDKIVEQMAEAARSQMPAPHESGSVAGLLDYSPVSREPTVPLADYRDLADDYGELRATHEQTLRENRALRREVERLQRGGPFEATSEFEPRDPEQDRN
jgi:hypothetical protein